VDEQDLSVILIPSQNMDPRGEKGFDTRMMTLLLLYAYCVGTVSSDKIRRAAFVGIGHGGHSLAGETQ
jgi:hypothetical protein